MKLLDSCNTKDDGVATLMFLALSYYDINMFDDAKNVYLDLLKIDETFTTAWSNLGIIYQKNGEYSKAIDAYEKSIKCDSENPYPYHNLGNVYLSKGEYETAIDLSQKALELKSNMYQAMDSLVIAYTMIENSQLADKYYKMSAVNGGNPQNLDIMLATYKNKESDIIKLH